MANTYANLCALSLLAASTVLGTSAFGRAPANPRIQVTGLDCLINQGAADVDQSNTKIHLEFDGFEANSRGLAQSRGTCSLFVSAANVRGWQFRLKSVTFNHDTNLERSGEATMEASYYFQGQSQSVNLSSTIAGPTRIFDEATTLNFRESRSIYSRCGAGRSMVLTPSVLLNMAEGGEIDVHSADLELEWKTCQ